MSNNNSATILYYFTSIEIGIIPQKHSSTGKIMVYI